MAKSEGSRTKASEPVPDRPLPSGNEDSCENDYPFVFHLLLHLSE